MPNTVEKIHVQRELIRLVRGGKFYAVTYDRTTNEPHDVDASVGGDPVTPPVSVQANEIEGAFVVDPRHRRGRILTRSGWTFLVTAQFKSEVTSYVAEEEWALDPPILKVTNAAGQVTLDLLRVGYDHPTRQQSNSGSRITFVFEARLSRR